MDNDKPSEFPGTYASPADVELAAKILKRRQCETLAEAAQSTVDDLESYKKRVTHLENKPAPKPGPDFPKLIVWPSRGIRLKLVNKELSAHFAEYSASLGGVVFRVRSWHRPEQVSLQLAVLLVEPARRDGGTPALFEVQANGPDATSAFEEAFTEVDIWTSSTAAAMTWGLK